MDSWTLALDFGTSATAVAVARAGEAPRLVNFGTASAMPSAILVDENGAIVTGLAALNQRRRHPERFEAYPKRHLGEQSWFLGRPVDPADAIGAVLRAAATAAARQFDGRPPTRLILTHPAGWEHTKLEQFTRAARHAGLGGAELVPEPSAAACFYLTEPGAVPGGPVAVYDLGGGTFDAAVIDTGSGAGTGTGRFVVRRSDGLDYVGGVAFDHTLLELIGERISREHPEVWAGLSQPTTPAQFQARLLLADDVRVAKETLSEQQQAAIYIPSLDADVLVTRSEFADAIRADVDASVDVFERTVRSAGLTAEQLSGIYLVGGSSAIPLVSETLFRRLGRRPVTRNDPKAVVALGATRWPATVAGGAGAPPARPAPAPSGPPQAVVKPAPVWQPAGPGQPAPVGPGGPPGPGAAQGRGPAAPVGPPLGPGRPTRPQPGGFGGPLGPPPANPVHPGQQYPNPLPPRPGGPAYGGPTNPARSKNLLTALVVVAVIVIGLIIWKVASGSGGNPAHTTSPAADGSPRPDPDPDPDPDPAVGWANYAQFTDLVGSSAGDTAGAYLNATCNLVDRLASDPDGLIDQIECADSADSVSYGVTRFSTSGQLQAFLTQVVGVGYAQTTWNKDSVTDVGELLTSPASLTLNGAHIAALYTTLCDLPTTLVYFRQGGSSATVTSLENDFWGKSSYPNTTPAKC